MDQLTLDINGLFLYNIRGKGKYKYAPYKCSPIRYAGGKSRAVGHVIEHLPSDVREIVSPFMGGGSIEIACANEFGIRVHGYDVFEMLVNYWKYQLEQPLALHEQLSMWKSTKEQYDENKQILKEIWDTSRNNTIMHFGLKIAALYWYNHNLSYGPGFLGWMSSIYKDEKRYVNALNRVKTFDAPTLSVKQSDFEDVFESHPYNYMYCDPPYFLDDGKMFAGIYPQRNFPIHHNGFKHKKLRDLLHDHENGFILSYNDCETIREWYSDFDIHEVQWQYTMGQGETRIGKNRIENGTDHVKKSHELIIVKKV